MHNKHIFLTILAGATAMLVGCASSHVSLDKSVNDSALKPVAYTGIEVGSRALPTQTATGKQPAHYDHVYLDPRDPSAESLKTIPLQDAIANDVLASSNLKVIKQGETGALNWLVTGKGTSRPSSLEGAGGAGVASNNYTEVNFEIDKTEILNRENLAGILKASSRVEGIFYVVGYADETGIERKNLTLSQDRAKSVVDYLLSSNINRTRIMDYGAGVSKLYPDLASNRRVSITFKVEK